MGPYDSSLPPAPNYISAIELMLDSISEMLLQESCIVSLNVNN